MTDQPQSPEQRGEPEAAGVPAVPAVPAPGSPTVTDVPAALAPGAGIPDVGATVLTEAPAVSVPPLASPPAWSPPEPDADATAAVANRPEVGVGAAFAGGFVLALILKRLAR